MGIKKVLTFRASSIGDSLMGKYFLENIRAAYPEARLALAVSSRVGMIRDLFAAYSWLEVVEANKTPCSLLALFKRGRNDVAVTPYTGGVYPLAPKLFARFIARTLVGYADKSRLSRFLYTKLIPLVGRSRAPRLLECDALAAIGTPVSIPRPTFTYLPQPQLLERLGLQAKNYTVLHLFSGSDARGLSLKRKQELIQALAAVLPEGMKLVLTGSDKERESLGNSLPLQAVSAQTTLQELAALVDQSALMVSLDTGAAHLAAHLQKPLIVLASCVGVQWWGSDMYGENIPTSLFTRLDVCKDGHDYSGYAKCLEAIDVIEVAEKARKLFRMTA
ncbi:MAG: glycosyltransferase family 9 protein [Candidatus Paceibacterota bacterium]|jgi:ADP-heptose:LPS heptosyltransferase